MTWLRAAFDADALGLAPGDALLLDARGLGRGHAWVNGHDLGLYWTIARDDAPFEETQRYYVVPREWLAKNGENEIVFAEAGGTAAFGAAPPWRAWSAPPGTKPRRPSGPPPGDARGRASSSKGKKGRRVDGTVAEY